MMMVYRKLTNIEVKLDKLLTERKQVDIRDAPPCFVLPAKTPPEEVATSSPCFVLPAKTTPEEVATSSPSCFAIDTSTDMEEEDSTATSQEDYVFKRHHLDDIHLHYYGYRLYKSEEERTRALEKAFTHEKNKHAILNHLYALWTVWQGRRYEDILRRDICWVEEKYF